MYEAERAEVGEAGRARSLFIVYFTSMYIPHVLWWGTVMLMGTFSANMESERLKRTSL